MKRLLTVLFAAAGLWACGGPAASPVKPVYMWVDCEANFARMSSPDSIAHYLDRLHGMGIDNVVVDVKSIMGEVLYKSDIAPYMGEWEGTTRSEDYDMLGHFISLGHRLGMKVYASLNVFAGGHNYFDRGIIYSEHPEWQSTVYWEGRLMPISEMKWNYNGMLNPANPAVQQYELDILKEFARKYPAADGIVFDRVRYDNITSDFSPLSKELFEAYAGIKVENYPDDILYWEKDSDGKQHWREGKHFKKWAEWRASVIKGFMQRAHDSLKAINPQLELADYTGAWYPTYYHVGVNWASRDYDPSKEFAWATPEYKNTGYAELLDLYMTGLYYTLVTKAEVDAANGAVGKRTEAGMDDSRSYWYCVEGGAELVRELTRGAAPVVGSIYVEQYEGDERQFERAVRQAMLGTDGVMIFDLVHIVQRDWWEALGRGIASQDLPQQ